MLFVFSNQMYNLINDLKEITIQSYDNLYIILLVPIVLLYQPIAEFKNLLFYTSTKVKQIFDCLNIEKTSMDTKFINTIESSKIWLQLSKYIRTIISNDELQ